MNKLKHQRFYEARSVFRARVLLYIQYYEAFEFNYRKTHLSHNTSHYILMNYWPSKKYLNFHYITMIRHIYSSFVFYFVITSS
jgi:hypothetical protein